LASIRFSEGGALGESWTPQLRGSTPRLEQGPSLNPVRYPAVTGLAGAMGAAKGVPISFHAVADHPAAAVFAGRREGMDCALEAVEGMRITSGYPDLESPVVLVAANFAPSHLLQSLSITHSVAWLLSYRLSGRSNPPLFTNVVEGKFCELRLYPRKLRLLHPAANLALVGQVLLSEGAFQITFLALD
jgi:hypothetical protein